MTASDAAFWALALIGHGAFWVELVNRLHGVGWNRRLIDAGTAVCGIAVTGLPLLIGWVVLRTPAGGNPPGWATGYATASLLALAVVVGMRASFRWDPRRDAQTRLVERTWLDAGASLGDRAASAKVLRLSKLPGNQVLRIAVEQRTIVTPGLPTELEGLRVAHLTDLHMSGRLSIDYFREVVRSVNAWRPDLVCLTGDLVEHTPQLDWVDSTLGELDASIGVFFVLGNHDQKIDSRELRRRLTSLGLVDVGGRTHVISQSGSEVTLCGDERPWFDGEPPLAADCGFTVCLAHSPDRFGWAIDHEVDLMLAGHNHGGQVCFPVIGPLLCPSRHSVRYASGTFRSGTTVMHVGRGTGSLFPLRYACPPEVGLLELTSG